MHIRVSTMELYHLRTFLAVAKSRHLTRAAERLHISQPSVSAHIKALEEELGLTLFIRTPKGMRLSPDGQALSQEASKAVQAADKVFHKAGQLKKNITGAIRAGLNIESRFLKISGLMAVLKAEFPGLNLHFFQRHSFDAHNQVLNGILDTAFVFESPKNPSLEGKHLSTFEISVVAPCKWKDRLAGKDLKELARFPWIWTDDSCPFNRIIKTIFQPPSLLPQKSIVADHEDAITEMVASGAGLGLMLEDRAREAGEKNRVSILMDRVASLDLYLIFRKSRADEPMINAMVRAACRIWDR